MKSCMVQGRKKGKLTFSESQVLCTEKLQIYFTLFVFISYKNYLNFSTCKFTGLSDLPLFMFMGQPRALWSPSKQRSLALLIRSGWYVISSFVRWHFAEYPWWILTLLLVRCYWVHSVDWSWEVGVKEWGDSVGGLQPDMRGWPFHHLWPGSWWPDFPGPHSLWCHT